jgi:hypothetical protein
MIVLLLGVAAITGGAVLLARAVPDRPRPWSDRTTRRLARASLAWTVLAGIVLLVAPTVSTVSGSSQASTSSADRPADVVTTTSSESLLQHEGPGVVVVLLVPVTVALVGALGTVPPPVADASPPGRRWRGPACSVPRPSGSSSCRPRSPSSRPG